MRCFAILGPASAGKSTLVDRLARLEGEPEAVAADEGFRTVTFRFGDEAWCALDTPGGAEALPAVRLKLLAADVALVCVPPDPDAAVLAAPYLRAVEAAGTPAILFVNRMDEATARVRDIVAALQDYARHVVVLRQVPIREGETVVGSVDLVSERAWRYRDGGPSALVEIPAAAMEREQEARAELLEHLSDVDDWLLEELVEDREPAAGPLYAICARTLAENLAIPALIGAAARGSGMRRLMKALRHEAPPVEALAARLAAASDGKTPLAVAYEGRYRRHVGKVTRLRALGDGVAAGGRLGGANLGGLAPAGADGRLEGAVEPGGVADAVKADQLFAGALLTREEALPPPAFARSPAPMVRRLLVPASEKDDVKLSSALTRIAETDPGLLADHDPETGALSVRVQGPAHLRAVVAALARDFGVEAKEADPPATFRETATRPAAVVHRHRKQTGGAGQFAEVALEVAPAPRGTGFSFAETVKGGAVPRNHIPAVEAGARDALAAGPLGFPVVDVAVTLTDGKHHPVDSSDLAFRIAGRAAVAEALEKAEPVLLQPILSVAFAVPSVYSGALVPVVSSLKGRVLGFEADGEARGWDVFRAEMPAAALDGLPEALRGATQGTGTFTAAFDHFEELYGREADAAVSARAAAVTA